ncbi:MAG: amidohydrolase [Thermodesulfobacteriota bacterium]
MTNGHQQTCDALLVGRVLTMDEGDRVFPAGAVAVRGDTIVGVGPAAELRDRFAASETVTIANGVIMPGLINVHTHAAMSCMRGLADDLPLMAWLQEHIFPVEGRLTGDMVYYAALLSMVEMIKSGTTTFCDMYLFARDVARAAEKSGMRAWIGEVLYDFPSPCYGDPASGCRHVEEMIAHYRHHPLLSVTVDPHAVYTCAPELLCRLKELADRHDCRYVIHLSETEEEVRTVLERFGCRPVAHLARLGILDSRVIADHCVYLTPEEIGLLAAKGVTVAHCPESNMKLASGVAPVPELLAAGVAVGLGTDGSASNNDVDLFGEMDMCAKLHKVHRLDPTVMKADEVLAMATREGARVLGAGAAIGALAPGKKADLIVVDLDQPHLTPLYHLPSHLVYAVRGGDVLHSMINGRFVMLNRQLTMLDEGEIMARANEIAGRLTGRG